MPATGRVGCDADLGILEHLHALSFLAVFVNFLSSQLYPSPGRELPSIIDRY